MARPHDAKISKVNVRRNVFGVERLWDATSALVARDLISSTD
jgi:hypothetical protein